MQKIVAIGGGDIGLEETLPIDKYIVDLAGKENPKMLFIPTASQDDEEYIRGVKGIYEKLSCSVDVLRLYSDKLSDEEIYEKILAQDIVYVGGGDTYTMIKLWKERGIDKALKVAMKKGVVMSGLSAGSICWFIAGNTLTEEENPRFRWVKGMGILPFLTSPHYENKYAMGFDKNFEGQAARAIVLEDCTAISVIDGEYEIIKSNPSKNAYMISWEDGTVTKTVIEGKVEL